MTPARNNKPTDGALRAAKQIEQNPSFLQSTAEIIDRETGVRELTDILENIITEAGDLIESRSPELAAQAHAALRRYADEAPRSGRMMRLLRHRPVHHRARTSARRQFISRT